MPPSPLRRLAALAARAALALLPVLAGACGGDRPADSVVLVSIDTLRPDHLGCYGYARPTSPHLDELCRDAVVYEEAIAAAPSTLPSHASMLTGLYPARHGAAFSRRRGLAAEVTTVAEGFAAAGFRTASFNDGGQVAARWGFDRGFEVYRSFDGDRFAAIVDAALAWLDEVREEDPDRRTFLFLHTYETHHPYHPSPEDLALFEETPYRGWLGREVGYRELRRINHHVPRLPAAEAAFITDAYDGEIHSMDRALGRLVAGLRRRGLARRTALVVTSDHGEELGEHGWYGWHSHTLYDELLRVPLVIGLAGGERGGRRVAHQVRGVDVGPTLLELAGLPVPSGLDGVALGSLAEEAPAATRFAVAELDGGGARAIRTRRWKLWGRRLFDLADDPGETVDAAAGNPGPRDALRRRLQAILAAPATTGEEVTLDEEALERLRSLGYLD